MSSYDKVRNIGISAHIDSGKTTLSERMLFYTGKIHKIEEVRGGGDGATMDNMELEKERGITIASAATTVYWESHEINIIDTPGHVDFTVEVERSLRVLDGAVLVLCSVGGVQSQSVTVDRQMKRYGIPRIAFINKMDRIGADPMRVADELRDKLHADALMIQLPIGEGETFEGVIDLIEMRAIYFDGTHGEKVRYEPIPADYEEDANAARGHMIEHLAMFNDEIMELMMEEQEVSANLIYEVLATATKTAGLTPVMMGTAYKNKGVQPLLDMVARILPAPTERSITLLPVKEDGEEITLKSDEAAPMVSMAFKLVDESFGQLTYMRIYQGTVTKGGTFINQRTGRKERFSRLLRMHSDKKEDIDKAVAGDIIAVTGIDAASGDTYCSEKNYGTLESMFIADPVIEMALVPMNLSLIHI